MAGGANAVYTGAAPGLVVRTNGVGSSRVYTLWANVGPNQPRMKLWGHSSCFIALRICWWRARNLAKYGSGVTVGGLQRNPATSSKETMLSILMDGTCTQGVEESTSQ